MRSFHGFLDQFCSDHLEQISGFLLEHYSMRNYR